MNAAQLINPVRPSWHRQNLRLYRMNNLCQFSPDRAHRYTLTHTIAEGVNPLNRIMWIGLNPSTADEQKLDPTLRRIREFSRGWGFDAFVMTNLFAFRATDPRDMKRAEDPVGCLNDAHLLEQASRCSTIVACWGAHGQFRNRDEFVLSLLAHRSIHCLGANENGTPKHPLYLRSNAPLVLFRRSELNCPPIGVDHSLIAKVEAATNGSNVHDVRSAIGSYVGYGNLPDKPEFRARFDLCERRLRAFLATGTLPGRDAEKGAAA
jgi:hypothetical protein